MKHNWKIMAGLGLTLVALGGVATWDEWKTKQDENEKETKGRLLSIKAESVVAIHLKSRPDSESGDKSADIKSLSSNVVDVTLKLENGSWTIKDPVNSNADQQVVTDLLKSLIDYKTESEVAKGKNQWQPFGLNDPRRSIELETTDGKKVTFLVGMNSPVGFSAYTATSEDDIVYAGSQYIATSTGKTLFDLRDKKFLGLQANEVTSISGKVKTESLSLTKESGQWKISAPFSAKGDLTTINNFLDDLTGLRATEFIDHPDSKLTAGLKSTKPWASWVLKSNNHVTHVSILDHGGATYVAIDGRDARYKIADDSRGKISKIAGDFRDKRIFGFESAQVGSVEVDGQTFLKVGSDWYQSADAGKFTGDGKFPGKPEDQPKPASHIRGLIVDLEYARAEEVFESQSRVSKALPIAPLHKVKLNLAGQTAPTNVEIWKADDNTEMVYVRKDGKSDVYKAKRTIIASISPAQVKPAGDELMPPVPSKD